MAEEEVKLFGMWASAYNRRVDLALKLKGIEYDYIEEDLSNKSQLLLKYNPIYQKIPILLHNGRPIAESLVILEYIDETWKDKPILPKDPHHRAKARFWAKFIDEMVNWPAAVKAYMEGGEKAIEESHELMKMLENELQGKDFFGGESIGYLDIVAMVLAFWYNKLWE
ncbi:hypothetical protein FEM48_Zijuj02G0066200 [Ziziphus jujuba var. spinosa]|uniref:glutathione transferase n=1 Tax=Ziziphus jujuba var. spinosa TaxID=714518 RepID=A0A978VU76_ZIZJJ|nr:hypothetical protein FEM48_Zijuj02G0066200 [Ziziphus jujuba var. spinosa]